MFGPTPTLRFAPTPTWRIFAHWYAGKHKKHRWQREKRYNPKQSVSTHARNNFSRKLHWKTNRWNYQQAYKDMP